MAQTIKHRRGKLERIKDITPISGELIIASGSDLSVHQSGLLFVGIDGNKLTPSNKILTGSATAPTVTGANFDHSVDGIPYYETDAKILTILGKGGNTNVELAHGQIDFNGSGIVSSSAQVSELAGIENSTITLTAGDGLKTGGTFTLNADADSTVTFNIDVSDFAGSGLEDDGSENLRIAAGGVTNAMLGGSIAASKLAGSIGDTLLSTISTANKVALSALDIDGASALGGAPAGADLIPIDDGAGGTNKSMTVTNLQSFMQSNLTFTTNTNTVDMGDGFVIEDGDGTEVTITENKEVKFVEGGGIDINWTDTDNGTDGDPYDLTFTIPAGGVTNAMLDGSIANGKLANSAITIAGTSTSLGGSITLATITNGTGIVSGSSQISVAQSMIAADAIDGTKLADDAVNSEHITDGSVDNVHLAGSIADTKLSTISTANKVSLSALDIDGASALGGAPAGADLIPIDDGAGGTNKSMTVTNLQSFMQSNLTFSSGDITGVTAGDGLTGGGTSGGVTVAIGAGNLIDVQADQIDVDLTELTDMTQTFVPGEDEFVVLDGGTAQKRKLGSEIFGSNAYTSTTIGTTTNALTVDDSSIQLNSGTTFNGSSARTISVKASGITNAMLAGSIANAKLANDGITIGTTDTSLGGTITAIVGLTDLDLAAGDRTVFDTVGANTLTIGGSSTDIVLPGNLTVSGTTTYINTTNMAIGDNILELNAAGSNDGGIYVRDAEGTSNSGSLLWNTGDDRWIGGVKGSEKILTFYNASPTTNTVLKANSSDLLVDSAISDDGTAVTISSNLIISGLTASQLVVTNGSKQLVSSTDISSLTLTLDGGSF